MAAGMVCQPNSGQRNCVAFCGRSCVLGAAVEGSPINLADPDIFQSCLRGELAKHAIAEGSKAVHKSQGSVLSPDCGLLVRRVHSLGGTILSAAVVSLPLGG